MTIAKKAKGNMLEGPLLRAIFTYTIPIILTGILQLLFNAADLVVVGQFCGELSVAAVGNAGTVTALVVNLFIGGPKMQSAIKILLCAALITSLFPLMIGSYSVIGGIISVLLFIAFLISLKKEKSV